jgi:hypothetical protein
MFKPKTNETVEGIVLDVGWYRCAMHAVSDSICVR